MTLNFITIKSNFYAYTGVEYRTIDFELAEYSYCKK